jgi:hypothetical protein
MTRWNLGPEGLFPCPFRDLVGEFELLILLMCGLRGGDFLLVLVSLAFLFFHRDRFTLQLGERQDGGI